MKIISHRINSLNDLADLDIEYGAEVDVRYHHDDLVLCHDPFGHQNSKPDKLDDFLNFYIKKYSGTIILNIKTEGIEERCIGLMKKYNYKNWFFLDLSMPYFVRYANKTLHNLGQDFTSDNLAVRFSEFEPIEYAMSFKDRAKWVWVDCFTKMPLTKKNYAMLKDAGFKICLVSPELQNHDIKMISDFRSILEGSDMKIDAVCTKKPNLWRGL